MGITRVVCLKIDTFRQFRDITIPFSDSVTLIAGQNGTSKSTLLGMLAQPFSFGVVHGKTARSADNSSYTDNYHGLALSDYVDFTGRNFMYNCDDVFRLSKEYDSNNSTYQYRTVLADIVASPNSPLENNTLFTRNRGRTTAKGVRFVTGPGASHKPGEGNFPHPVIYLGLNRLWPLANTKNCIFTGDALSNKDREWYIQKYNEVLCLDEYKNSAKFMDTIEKRKFITPLSSNYDGESCSAGQDNLSQLLTAILSFRGLKKKLGDKYQGGMLLIDELDATLHAFAQDKLLELLCKVSEELGLQIIATSHSLRLLEKAYQSSLKKNIEVLYLANEDDKIITEKFSTYQEIRDLLKVEATPPAKKKPRKVSVVFEDDEGMFLFKQICGSKLRNYASCANTATLGGGQLKNLSDMSKSLPELKNMIFIPDGDMAKIWDNPPKNLLALPGDKRPETLVYQHLYSMKGSDPFWKNCGTTYTKQFALTRQGGISLEKGDDKKWVKKWYKEQDQYWGRGNEKVFKSWVQAHKTECLQFCRKFVKRLRRRYKGEVPKGVIDRTLAEFKDP
jgi:predicted ATPase